MCVGGGQAVFILCRRTKEAIREKFCRKIWSQPYNLVKERKSDNMAVFNLFHVSPCCPRLPGWENILS